MCWLLLCSDNEKEVCRYSQTCSLLFPFTCCLPLPLPPLPSLSSYPSISPPLLTLSLSLTLHLSPHLPLPSLSTYHSLSLPIPPTSLSLPSLLPPSPPPLPPSTSLKQQRNFPTLRVHFPVLSSREIHTNYADCIRSLGKLVLSKACENKISVWKPIARTVQNVSCGLSNVWWSITEYWKQRAFLVSSCVSYSYVSH